MFFGDTGVGLSRMARECAGQAKDRGLPLIRGSASASAQLIPLGALGPILPVEASAGSTDNLAEVFARAQAAYRAASHERRILLIDDLHLLDETSAALIRHLQTTTDLFLLGTVHIDREASEPVSALWSTDQIRRVDLHRLSRAESDQLLVEALGGPVDGVASAELWDAGHGNPLLLHELVVAAISSGALAPFDGVWRVDDELPMAGNVPDLVRRRLSGLTPEGRALLEDIAVGQPVDLADLERAYPAAVIEAAERGGYISVREDGLRVDVRITYRAHLDVLRLDLAPGRLTELSRAHIDRVEGHGGRRRDDPLRLARWYLDGTGAADPDVLLRAANLARGAHDFVTVERLVTAALVAEPSVDASRLRGEALYELGSFKEAEVELQRAERMARTETERTLVAATRSTNLFWGLVQPADALAVLATAEAGCTTPAFLHELAARRASVSLHSGWPARALEELPPMVEGETRARLEASMVRSLAYALTGAGDAAIEVTDAGFAEHVALGDFSGIAHPGTHMVNKCVVLSELGRLSEAWDLAAAGYEIAVAERVPIAKMWFAMQMGRIALLQGRVLTARHWFREVVAHAGLLGHPHPLRLGLAGVGVSSACLDDPAGAAQAAEELQAYQGPAYGFFGSDMTRAEAWSAVLAGRPAEGQRRLLEAAAETRENGQRTQEAAVLYDFVRVGGDAAEVAERLGQLAEECDGQLVSAWAAHVEALRVGDVAALVAVSVELERLGAILFAAEAAAAASDRLRATGDQRAATAQANRVVALGRECEGARTPALPAQRDTTPLTARELEIARLVARGLPSREVAGQLFLSVRTVQSHLQRIFTKLGVTSRAELAGALEDAPDDR